MSQNQALRKAVQSRFGAPFKGVEFTLDSDRKLVTVERIRLKPSLWLIKAGGNLVLHSGEPGALIDRNQVSCPEDFDFHHLRERCQAITALLDLEVVFRDHAIAWSAGAAE